MGRDYRIARSVRKTPLLRVLPLLLSLLAGGTAAVDDPDVQRNKEALDRLRGRIHSVEKSLEKDRSLHDSLRQQLEETERRLVALTRELRDLKARIDEQTARRRKTAAQREQAEHELHRQRSALARQVRAAYIVGQRGKAKLLLNQDRTQQLSRVMTYYDYLNRARTGRITQVLDLVGQLLGLEARLEQETAMLESTRNQHQGALTALEAARQERRGMVRQLGQRIATEEGELRQLRADEGQLRRLIEELQAALADIPGDIGAHPFNLLRGKLPWPVRGKLLAQFGELKAGGALRWNGVWIAGKEGDPVRAVARGRVAYVGWMHRYGLIAVLEHEGGYYSLYGHAQGVPVSIGDWVNEGDVIATVGVTGGHEKAGVYFEIRKGTDPVNPQQWLRRS